MTQYLITTWFGTFLCDEHGVHHNISFPPCEQEIMKRLQDMEHNQILEEEKKIVKGQQVVVNEKRLQPLGTYKETDPFFTTIALEPQEYGFTQEMLHTVSTMLTKQRVEEQLRAEDLQIIQMVNALDDLVQTANLLSERLSAWSLIPTPKKKVKPFEKTLAAVTDEIHRLEDQIETDMKRLAPNTSVIIGPLVGARLLALAGGMQRMAMLPASTIQILGAEKALFHYKKEGGKPPKHGVIFQHPFINRAPKSERGRIARLLATKTSMAIKADVFTKRNISKDLTQGLEQRLQEIRKTK